MRVRNRRRCLPWWIFSVIAVTATDADDRVLLLPGCTGIWVFAAQMPFDGREKNRMHPDLARQISETNSGAANFVPGLRTDLRQHSCEEARLPDLQ